MRVVRQPDIQIEDWRRFVDSCKTASFYHLPEWSHILESTFGYKPYNLFALDDQNKICGILPLSYVKSPIMGSHLVCLPFSHVVGPLYSTGEVLDLLLQEAKSVFHSLKCEYLEIRMKGETERSGTSTWIQQEFENIPHFSTYVLSLSSAEELWARLDSTRRWAVRKAQKNGVTCRKTDSKEDILKFFDLNCANKKTLGIPGHPLAFFLNLFEELGDHCHLYLAEYQQKIVAGIITLEFGEYVFYGYAASAEDYKKYQPNVFLVWRALEDSCNSGYKFFDFGRVSSTEQNLATFKLNWGTSKVDLDYQFFPKAPRSMTLNRGGSKYKVTTAVWKRMPLPLVKMGSNIVFKHLG